MSESEVVDHADAEEITVHRVVGKVAHAIENTLSAGDLAELRRISPDQPFTPALWKLLLAFVPDPWTAGDDRDEKEGQWAALFMGLSIAAGLHEPRTPLGQALAEAGWSELRFVRLMRDRGPSLVDRVRRLAHYLASKSQHGDWADVAQLLLNQQGEWAERHRRRVSRSYYRTLYRQSQ